MLVQLSKLSKSFVKIMKLKFGQDYEVGFCSRKSSEMERYSTVAMRSLCGCYVVALLLLCSCFAVAMRSLCGCYAVPMQLLYSCNAVAMWLLCGCYAVAIGRCKTK